MGDCAVVYLKVGRYTCFFCKIYHRGNTLLALIEISVNSLSAIEKTLCRMRFNRFATLTRVTACIYI